MRPSMSVQLLVVFLLLASNCIAYPYGRTDYDANNTVMISMSDQFFIDLPNPILIRSLQPLTRVTIEMQSYGLKTDDKGITVFDGLETKKPVDAGEMHTYELRYFVPFEMKPGTHFNLNLTYFYCPSNVGCQQEGQLVNNSVRKDVRFVSQFTVIMGETDKPLYRPGETVRYRFLALTSHDILPSTEPRTWPSYRAVGEQWDSKVLEPIDSAVLEKRTRAPKTFDSIVVKDTLGNIVSQMEDVSQMQALNLSLRLLKDASEGEWKIEAKVMESSTVVVFQVKNYVLPRFQANVKLPETIPEDESNVNISVCAAYTNGPSMMGTYDTQVCVCSLDILEKQEREKKLLPRNECAGNYGSAKRTCMRLQGVLGQEGCSTITANITNMIEGKRPSWLDRLGVFVEVTEEATGSSLVVSGISDFKRYPDPKFELKLPDTFRHGIPIQGQFVYRNRKSTEAEEVELIVKEVTDPCGGWFMPSRTNPTRLKRLIQVSGDKDEYDFVLPPLEFENPASVEVRQVPKPNASSETSPPERPVEINEVRWLPKPNLGSSKRLELWDGQTGLSMQVTVQNRSQISCPGSVKLLVQTNRRLPANSKLTLEFLARGQLSTRSIELEVDDKCVSRDDDLGHYECESEDGEIRCLDGWTGANCLTPVCECKGEGGVCVSPGKCVCKPGWKGESCEVCIPLEGCENGVCKEGGDCVCHKGFTGPLCNLAEVVLEYTDKEDAENNESERAVDRAKKPVVVDSSPRRTVFDYEATLQLDDTMGPTLRAVASIVVGGERATDFVSIEDIQACSSPLLAESASSDELGFKFDKSVVAPGEGISMTLNIGGKEASTCLLQIADVATQNFESKTTSRIDFGKFIDVIKDYSSLYPSYRVSDTVGAYSAAGIDFSFISNKTETIRPIHICPRFSYRSFESGSVQLMSDSSISMPAPMNRKSAPAPKPRLRDFFPEVWLFEAVNTTATGSLSKNLTTPDTLTSWEANSVCFAPERGLWMARNKPRLTVKMPFFVEFLPPVLARRGEILHLPISVFVYPPETKTADQCFAVEVSVAVDASEWRVVGASKFEACVCSGEEKATMRLALRPLRVGALNVTATAVARMVGPMCGAGGSGFSLSDAVRRQIRVVPEGTEKRVTTTGTFCTSADERESNQEMKISIPDKDIVADSLRSYVAIGGNVLGRALSNLGDLVRMPTGCGEQNLVKVAPSVYILRYLLSSEKLTNNELARKAASYILSGFDNQLKYVHPDTGAFSTFGPNYGAKGNTWLTAYVFEVFSEAEKLPIASIASRPLNAHETLVKAFDFLVSRQGSDGCFEEAGRSFLPEMTGQSTPEQRLQLTAHVLSAIGSATAALKEVKGENYTSTVKSALRCIEEAKSNLSFSNWSTPVLARVILAMKGVKDYGVDVSLQKKLMTELSGRASEESDLSGSLKWWKDTTSSWNSYYYKQRELETTAYAFLALSPNSLSRGDQLATIRWMAQSQNEKGGFYSTRDTVIGLRALTENANNFPSPASPTTVSMKSKPVSSSSPISVELNASNMLVSNVFEIGSHNLADISSFDVAIESTQPAHQCVSVQFTSIYNLKDESDEEAKLDKAFEVEIAVDQGGSKSTAACTTAHTTICIRRPTMEPSSMLLATLQLPSGWAVTMKELDKIPLNGDVQRLEFDRNSQEVSIYFNGFTGEMEESEKCVSILLHQRTFVEKMQPGSVEVKDYYKPTEMVQLPLNLDSCELYWEPPMGGIVTSSPEESTTTTPQVTPEPKPEPVCPTCDKIEPPELLERLNASICHHRTQLYVFNVTEVKKPGEELFGVMYSFGYGSLLASWNTTVTMAGSCECSVVTEKTAFGLFGDYIHSGALKVNVAGRTLVPFEDLFKVAPDFQKAVEVKKAEEKDENIRKYWCSGHKSFLVLTNRLSS